MSAIEKLDAWTFRLTIDIIVDNISVGSEEGERLAGVLDDVDCYHSASVFGPEQRCDGILTSSYAIEQVGKDLCDFLVADCPLLAWEDGSLGNLAI